MPLTGQELHFADQIDGLLERVNKIEQFLGGRWKIADSVRCYHTRGLVSQPAGWYCASCQQYFTIRPAQSESDGPR